ncbi:DNA polymerase III subunit alpha [Thermosipho sp. (in: thermotogales)]|uniref:DNA polymerase III subunit alpha n=1 Tax=Thermosipho sp. (in: thermotogales) TaxID=1968895 RepID=UPI00257CC983|nr:DNA polymerase III subunit alpha [Thermosipho sp. (in: thermotogales)]MBZ4649272.1 polymerase subunit alpha [Thermosipho sp. (in: thermotogales)]
MKKLKKNINMCHLHVHTDYSVGDGCCKISDLISKTKELGMDSIAITDHGSLSGFLKFYKTAKDLGINPILGEELYVNDDREEIQENNIKRKSKEKDVEEQLETKKISPNNHLIVLAKNWEGFKSIMKIHADGVRNGFYYKPRTTHNIIKELGKNIIVTTACMGGKVGVLIREGKFNECKRFLLEMKEVFKDDFYLELQFLESNEQHLINEKLLEFSKQLKIPYIITNDIHYVNKGDDKLQDIHKMIYRKKKISDNLDDVIFKVRELYLKTPYELLESAKKWQYNITKKEILEGLDRTLEVAEKCKNIEVPLYDIKFPKYYPDPKNIDENFDAAAYLTQKVNQGFKRRLMNKQIPKSKINEYKERARHELDVIIRKGYSDYMLIVSGYIDFCNKNKIFHGAGRGSAAGSLISWLIGITEIDPIKNGLIFERFLNEDRADPPDIDEDFDSERKDLIEQYLIQQYGEDHIAHIISFGTYGAKGVVRDVGRVLEKDFVIIDKVAKSFDNFSDVKSNIERILNEGIEKDIIEFIQNEPEFFEYCSKLEGMVRQYSQHASGTVVTPGPLEEYIPIMKIEGKIVTGIQEGADIRECSDMGILKLDILGLNWCTILRRGIELIKERHGIDLWDKIWTIDYDDPKLMAEFAKGNTEDIFQYSSKPMREFIKRVAGSDVDPKKATVEGVTLTFNDLVAINAGWRPAVIMSGATDVLACNKHKDLDEIEYLHESMRPALEETYGALIYQEQFMRILMDTAGFTAAEADKARKTLKYLNKGKYDPNSKSYKEFQVTLNKLQKAWSKRGFSDKQIEELTQTLAKFIDYSFNKSHSCSYATAAVQGMYLKVYYPLEYFTGLLQSTKNAVRKDLKGRKDRDKNLLEIYIRIARESGIEVLPPLIDKSKPNFEIEDKSIRAGLTMIKSCGEKAAESILKAQPIKSIEEFFSSTKVDWRRVNKKVIESLIKVGAFDNLYPHRKRLLKFFELWNNTKNKQGVNNIHDKIKYIRKYLKQAEELVKDDFTNEEKLKIEYELYGFYFGQHPFDKYKKVIEEHEFILPYEITVKTKKAKVAGFISNIKTIKTKFGEKMAFIELSDTHDGKISVTIWPEYWRLYKKILKEGNCVVMKVKRNSGNDKYKDSFVLYDKNDGKKLISELSDIK